MQTAARAKEGTVETWEISDSLDFFAPPYSYFGAHEGDGADFGYWVSEDALQDLERFNEKPEGTQEDDYIVVNDHGNITLYSADGIEIWAIV